MKRLLFLLFPVLALCTTPARAQWSPLGYDASKVHSHNDYSSAAPFTAAYDARCGSIEADIVLSGNELYVTHNTGDINASRTLRKLYLEPIIERYRANGDRPYPDRDYSFCLVLDIKQGGADAVAKVFEQIGSDLDVFDTSTNPLAVKIIFSGSRPAASTWADYPAYVWFDHTSPDLSSLNAAQRSHLGMISLQYGNYLTVTDLNELTVMEYATLKSLVTRADGIPVRLWEAPDNERAWYVLANSGMGYVNTDQPDSCADYFENYRRSRYPALALDREYAPGAADVPLVLTRPYDAPVYEAFRIDGTPETSGSLRPSTLSPGRHSVEYRIRSASVLTVVETSVQIR